MERYRKIRFWVFKMFSTLADEATGHSEFINMVFRATCGHLHSVWITSHVIDLVISSSSQSNTSVVARSVTCLLLVLACVGKKMKTKTKTSAEREKRGQGKLRRAVHVSKRQNHKL